MPRTPDSFASLESGFCVLTDFCWSLIWVIANVMILAPRAYIAYKEEGMPAAEQFALRGGLISFVSGWFVFAIATVVLDMLSCNLAEAFSAHAILGVEFVGILLWYHYYCNGDLMKHVVEETRARMSYLLIQGLGMMDTEREKYWKEAEEAVVSFWRRQLKKKPWRCYSPEERGALFFETGIECGKILEKQWEGVLYDVLAFYNEWRLETERHHRIRMPRDVADSMKSGNDAGKQALLCVAIIIANEDKTFRDARNNKYDPHRTYHQFCGARIARRKTAAEGILRWPDILFVAPRVEADPIEMDKSGLCFVAGDIEMPCTKRCLLPYSVLYTLVEIINAGYIRIPRADVIDLSIAFEHGYMVFDKNHWNLGRAIERKPFRFITSVTRIDGNVAFMIEQREFTGSDALLDGSSYLKGTLRVRLVARELPEEDPWADAVSITSTKDAWGFAGDIASAQYVHPLDWPAICIVHASWFVIHCVAHFGRKILRQDQRQHQTRIVQGEAEMTDVVIYPSNGSAVHGGNDNLQNLVLGINKTFEPEPILSDKSLQATQASTYGRLSVDSIDNLGS